MWKKCDGPRVEVLTKKLVDEWVGMTPCPDDRPLKKHRMDAHRQSLKEEKLRSPEWAYALCRGNMYRVNGKHTSNVLQSEWDSIKDKEICVVITGYDCDTLEDLADLYATFDNKVQTRTASEVYNVFKGSRSDLCEIPLKIVTLSIQGLSYNLWEEGASRHNAAEKAQLLMQYPSFAAFLYEIFGNRTGKAGYLTSVNHMYRMPVVAAMARTWFKRPEKAKLFWELVRDSSSPDNKAPDRVLAMWLLSHTVTAPTGNRTFKKGSLSTPKEMMTRCIHAWNAWIRQEVTSLRYSPENPIPKAV